MTLTIGSLFSGIGGLELGLEWAGFGPVLWQVEQSDYCRGVLSRHWPDAKRYEDVCDVGAANLAPVDLICGGFPCQDVSAAGKGAGLDGARSGLWYEFLRVVSECRPVAVVVENVASGACRWVDACVAGLAELGYQTLPVPLSAADCGAPHLRRRVFLVAVSNADRKSVRKQPGRGGWQGRAGSPECGGDGGEGRARGASERLPPPYVDRAGYGVPQRLDRIRALGNAVVPQCAQVVGEVLRTLLERQR